MNGMDAKCGGCGLVIDQESGGVVVAFGSSLWHVDCFRCAKCKEKVSADTNLLLLSDGSPVCGNCSYQCFVCKQAITEEAIMTGDESYHAHCFTCRTCKRRIEELVFAKTSQGIYCMACHNERVAKSRRHAEAKRQRQARREAKEREREEEEQRQKEEEARQAASSSAPPLNYLNAGHSTPSSMSLSHFAQKPQSRPHSPYTGVANAGNAFEDAERENESRRDLGVVDKHVNPRSASPAGRQLIEAQNMPLPASPSESNDGNQLKPGTSSPQIRSSSHAVSQSGLGVPTSKAEKRRSISPGMTFNLDAQNSTFTEQRLGTYPPSPLRSSFTDGSGSASNEQRPVRSPTSPSPAPSGKHTFPFKDGSGSGAQLHQAQAQVTEQLSCNGSTGVANQPPARTSSLPEHLANRAKADEHVAVEGTHPSQPNSAELAPGSSKAQLIGETRTPQLHAPDLPNMSFSLSDPDFAVILSNMDQSPRKIKTGEKVRPEVEIASGESAPSSPLVSSPSLARSPTLDMLSTIESDPQSRSQQGALGRSRLSPNDPSPHMLNRRQASADSSFSVRSRHGDGSFEKLVELLAGAKFREEESVNVDVAVLSGIVKEVEDLREAMVGLKKRYTGAKRSSQQYSEGLSVAGEEYDKERSKRTELEAEVSRLRAQLHSQTARLSVISGDEKRAEHMKRRSRDLASNLTGLERDISRLRAERDMKLAEVDELAERTPGGVVDPGSLAQSLSLRLDSIRDQYATELESLSGQVENLQREISELRQIKEASLEESAALAAKNEDLAELNTQLTRQTEALQDTLSRTRPPTIFSKGKGHQLQNSPSLASLTGQGLQDVPEETITARVVKVSKPEPIEAAPVKRFKWYKSSKGPDASNTPANISKPLAFDVGKTRGGMTLGVAGLAMGGIGGGARPSTEFGMRDHAFQQHTMMRFTRCELCGEKMWGLQEVKCSSCGIVCHSKCAEKLPRGCTGTKGAVKDEAEGPLPPSMFGRPLVEQVSADKQSVPVIVTKCINAVEAVGMEYEGIYRKTGGSSQSKQITQLFERGDYDAFDLADVDAFNDISSVTSVLKTYFRSLPNPLFTHELHESFVTAATIRDTNNKRQAVLALLHELPKEHYNTLKALMLHLNRVTSYSGVNLMSSQNLGVVFGPTLMRSSDPNREFGDMAGKALSVQWLVDNAPSVFTLDRD